MKIFVDEMTVMLPDFRRFFQNLVLKSRAAYSF